MNSFEISKLVIISVYADTEKQAGISPIDNFVVPELVSRLVFTSERSEGSIPQQSWTDTSGLVGRLPGALPHVSGPIVEGSGTLIAGVPPGNHRSLSRRRRMVRTTWTAWSCPDDSTDGHQRIRKAPGRAPTCTRINLIMQEDRKMRKGRGWSCAWFPVVTKRRGRVNAADNPGRITRSAVVDVDGSLVGELNCEFPPQLTQCLRTDCSFLRGLRAPPDFPPTFPERPPLAVAVPALSRPGHNLSDDEFSGGLPIPFHVWVSVKIHPFHR